MCSIIFNLVLCFCLTTVFAGQDDNDSAASNSTSTTPPVPTSTQPNASSVSPWFLDDNPRPIQVIIEPNVTEYNYKMGNLTCHAVGSNLDKIYIGRRLYTLSWYERRSGIDDIELLYTNTTTSIVLSYELYKSKINTFVYCAFSFNDLRTKYYRTISSHYVALRIPKRDNTTGKTSSESTTTSSQLADVTTASVKFKSKIKEKSFPTYSAVAICAVVVTILLLVLSIMLYRRNMRQRNMPQPPDFEPSACSQENDYTYVPLETIPFEKTRELVTANQKRQMQSVKPPPVPARPFTYIRDDNEDYIYSYAYGIRNNHHK